MKDNDGWATWLERQLRDHFSSTTEYEAVKKSNVGLEAEINRIQTDMKALYDGVSRRMDGLEVRAELDQYSTERLRDRVKNVERTK